MIEGERPAGRFVHLKQPDRSYRGEIFRKGCPRRRTFARMLVVLASTMIHEEWMRRAQVEGKPLSLNDVLYSRPGPSELGGPSAS